MGPATAGVEGAATVGPADAMAAAGGAAVSDRLSAEALDRSSRSCMLRGLLRGACGGGGTCAAGGPACAADGTASALAATATCGSRCG